MAKLHGVSFDLHNAWWQSIEPMPTFFPNTITLSADLKSDSLLQALPTQGTHFIKDSFANLALEEQSFIKLFEAQWYMASPTQETFTPFASNLKINEATDSESLSDWEQAWRGEENFAAIFTPSFLENDTVRFFSVEHDDKRSGITTFFDGQSLGIYNLWGDKSLISCLLSHISTLYPDTPIVGYGDEQEVNSLDTWGFKPLGPLAVWGRFE